MKSRVHLSKWKSPDAERRFHEREDNLIRERAGDMPVAIDVETSLGTTCAYSWKGTGEPVVFLHGAGGNATSWTSYAEHRRGRTMYAVDTIGDLGRSRQQVAVENADDLSRWLDETLTGLGLERAHLAGTSYGAFLALNLAARRPDRVRSLYLIEPAGLVRADIAKFMLWGMTCVFASLLPAPVRRIAARRLRNPLVEDKELIRLGMYGNRNHQTRLLRPAPLSDEQLQSIAAPARVVFGAKSEIFPMKAARARADLIPHATTEVIGEAGHAVAMSHVDPLASEVARFVDRHAESREDRAPGNDLVEER